MTIRHCHVEITNNSSYTLSNPRVFAQNGHCETPLPPMVGPSSNAMGLFNKTTGAMTGAVGVFTYDIFNSDLDDYDHMLAVMYSVPFERFVYSNVFAVGVFEKGTECDYDLYKRMYDGGERGFVRATTDEGCVSLEGDYIIVKASMSDSNEAVLKLTINDIGLQ